MLGCFYRISDHRSEGGGCKRDALLRKSFDSRAAAAPAAVREDTLRLPSRQARNRLWGGSPPRQPAGRRRYTSARLLMAVLTLAAFQTAAAVNKPAVPKKKVSNAWSVQWQPAQLVNGAPVVFQIVPPARLTGLSAKWLEHDVFFDYDATSKTWYGIAGVSLETHPGIYLLELKGTTSRGSEISFTRKIAIRPAKYPSIAVTVAKRFTEPSHEQLQRSIRTNPSSRTCSATPPQSASGRESFARR